MSTPASNKRKSAKPDALTDAALCFLPHKWRKRAAALIMLWGMGGSTIVFAVWKTVNGYVHHQLVAAVEPIMAEQFWPYSNRVEAVESEGVRREDRIRGYCQAVLDSRSNSSERVWGRLRGIEDRVGLLESAR